MKANILNFIGVFTQFCLLSASKKQKITYITRYTTQGQDKQHKQDNMKDKLIKGLGVSLAKTPLMVLLKNKTDAPQKRVLHGNFFLCVLCCLVVLLFVTVASSQECSSVLFVCIVHYTRFSP